MRKLLRKALAVLCSAFVFTSAAVPAYADTGSAIPTSVKLKIYPEGVYDNWDGVSNVAQFIDNEGRFCFAYNSKENVTVVRLNKENKVLKNTVVLKKTHPLFGTAICDSKGNFYVVTGEENKGGDRSTKTVFITKYDKNGKAIATVGDNGSSSLSYGGSDFYTKIPFDGGTCSAAINGNLLTVDYARIMYSGHQSNSVLTIDMNSMKKKNIGDMYSSHSFSQRAIPFGKGFVYASEGDAYDRAFTINTYTGSSISKNKNTFHFWVKKGTFDKYDMLVLNNNFAKMGGIAKVNDKLVALVGTSARSLSSDAAKEPEDLFIQIFDPTADLSKASSYVTSGTRSGIGGVNGDQKVKDHGVMWLSNSAKNNTKIKEPQIVSIGSGKVMVLFEKYNRNGSRYDYAGVYYCVINSKGKLVGKSQCFSKTAKLNACVMPVYSKGNVYWAGNKYGDSGNTVYAYNIKIS